MSSKHLPFYQSLNGRFWIALFIIGVLPIAVLGTLLIRTQQRSLIEKSGQLLQLDAASYAKELNWFVAELQRDTQAIVSLNEIRRSDAVVQQRTLDTLKEGAFSQFGKLAIVDLSGNILLSNPPTPTGTNIAHVQSFQAARKGQQAWVIASALASPKLVMHMHTPIHNDAGDVVAVLGSPVGLPVLHNILADDIASNEEIKAYVLDGLGDILLASESGLLTNGVDYADSLTIDAPAGDLIYELEGASHLAGFTTVNELGWTVVVEQPLNSVLMPARLTRTMSIVTVLGAILGSTFCAYAAARLLTRPVRKLARAASDLGKGKTDAPLPQVTSAEITTLVDAFANMRVAVVEREHRLKQAELLLRDERELLSERVKLRTAELETINQELEDALKTKDKFVATMSHELRTPLNAILGITDALSEGVYEPLKPRQSDMVMRVNESGAHLLELINNILNVAKMESGQFELDLSPTDVQGLCRSSIELVRPNAEKKQLTIACEIDDRIRLVESDGLRLKQILVNLLSNAVKFTPDQGSVGLDVIGDAQCEWIRFVVWDTGIGVDSADVERVFQPFVQLDGRLARQHAGTGLGLALSRQLAQLHGGKITLESKPGVGSRFTVTIPWRKLAIPDTFLDMPELQIDVPLPERRTEILLVEDNEWGVATFQDYLEFKGFEVFVARNGREALDYVDASTPDLILMDVQMPIMDGLECTRRLRDRNNTAETPIIALTGLAMDYDRDLCLMAGANEYMAKPVELEQLVSQIQKHLVSAEIVSP